MHAIMQDQYCTQSMGWAQQMHCGGFKCIRIAFFVFQQFNFCWILDLVHLTCQRTCLAFAQVFLITAIPAGWLFEVHI